jgi:hypothetical protein
MPLLAILAVGMIGGALSSGFDFLYPLRVVAALVVLAVYRRRYAAMNGSFSWRAPAVGAVIFGAWMVFAHVLVAPKSKPEPEALTSLPGWGGSVDGVENRRPRRRVRDGHGLRRRIGAARRTELWRRTLLGGAGDREDAGSYRAHGVPRSLGDGPDGRRR